MMINSDEVDLYSRLFMTALKLSYLTSFLNAIFSL